MLLPTHLLITTLVAQDMNLSGFNLFLAYLFGVGVDVDHLFYIKRACKADFWLSKGTDNSDHTWIHEPFGLLVVAIISLYITSYIPIMFYSIHFILDQLVAKALKKPLAPFNNKMYTYGLIPSGSKVEWLLSPIFLIISIYLIVRMYV